MRRENINTNLKLSCLGADGREKVRYKAQKFMAMRPHFFIAVHKDSAL